MGGLCCYTNRYIKDEDEDLAKSIIIEVINIKGAEEILTEDSIFQHINHDAKFSYSSSFSNLST
jgi:hypothetical protein